jgi:hypothetical protein
MNKLNNEQLKKIISDEWLLMDDCEGLVNCEEIKNMAAEILFYRKEFQNQKAP